MKKLLLLMICSVGAMAQVYAPTIISVTTAPSGSCTNGLPNRQVISTGVQYSCQAGTWGTVGTGAGGPPTGAAGGALSGSYPNPTLNPSIVGSSIALTASPSTTTPVESFTSTTGASSDSLLTEWNANRLYLGYYGDIYTSTPGFLADVTGGKAIANTIACTIPFTSPLGTCTAVTVLDATGFGIGTAVGAASGQPWYVTPAGAENSSSINTAGAANIGGVVTASQGLNVSSNGAAITGNTTVAGSVTVSGGITATPDGVHAGYDSLAGNTTPYTVSTNTAGWMGPPSASFTAYALQLPATGPTNANPLLSCATPSAGVSACSYVAASGTPLSGSTSTAVSANTSVSTAAAGTIATLDGSGNASGTTALAPVNGDCVVGSGGAWIAGSCGSVTSTYYISPLQGGQSSTLTGTANHIVGYGFIPSINVTFSNIYTVSATADASDLYSVAIANSSGTLVCHPTTGLAVPTAHGLMTNACSEGSVSLTAGSVYILLTTGNATTGALYAASNSAIASPYFNTTVIGCTSASGVISGTCSITLAMAVMGEIPNFSLH